MSVKATAAGSWVSNDDAGDVRGGSVVNAIQPLTMDNSNSS